MAQSTRKPDVLNYDVYEVRARITVRFRCFGLREAEDVRERLRSHGHKVGSFLRRKLGLRLRIAWEDVKLVGQESSEYGDE